jgi:hypothetical protein
MKYDYDYSLGILKPNVVYQTWDLPAEQLTSLMAKHGFRKGGRYWFR